MQEGLDFDFGFGGSSAIKILNNVPNNELIPRDESLLGAILGDISAQIFITDDTEVEKIDDYRVIIEQVDCSTGDVLVTLYDKEFDGDFALDGLLLATEDIGPPGEETTGYFNQTNTNGLCYKATVIAESECGQLEQFSYFNIAQSCSFCLVQEESGAQDIEASSGILAEVFPLPATSVLNVHVSKSNAEEEQIKLTLLNSTGQVLQNVVDVQAVEGFNFYEIDVSAYPAGLYLLSISNGQQRISRKVIVE